MLNGETDNMTEINKLKEENNTLFSVLEGCIKRMDNKLDILLD